MVAYQPGKAANMPAAATISHTSLPSQTGPMVAIATRRPASSRPTTPWSMPTPKSKPSSTRNPVHSTVRTMNQKVTRDIANASVGEVEDGFLVLRCGGDGSELLAGEVQHQRHGDDRQDDVQ